MSSMAIVTALLVLALVAVSAMAADYTVGDSSGWSQSVDYSTWASDKTFNVGDTLLFQYGFLHSVDEVTKSDYDACSTSNTLQSNNDQNTKITLDKAGPRYFICGTSGHCTGGMKLAITVASESPSGGGSPPTTPSGSPSTPSDSPSTPSGTPAERTPTKNTPSTTGVNAAAGGGIKAGDLLMAGAVLLGGVALMG